MSGIDGEKRFCPNTISEADYRTFQTISLDYVELGELLSRLGHANWTMCPQCQIDDFTHEDGCTLVSSITATLTPKENIGWGPRRTMPHPYCYAPSQDAGPTDTSCGDCAGEEFHPIHRSES